MASKRTREARQASTPTRADPQAEKVWEQCLAAIRSYKQDDMLAAVHRLRAERIDDHRRLVLRGTADELQAIAEAGLRERLENLVARFGFATGVTLVNATERPPGGRQQLQSGRRGPFTTLRQIDQLVGTRETDPDMGFLMRMLAICTLPRTNPGQRLQYVRESGPWALTMTATSPDRGLPYGNLPRLLLAWISTEVVRTGERELVLGHSLAEFMRKLGLWGRSGGERGDRTRLRNQMERLFHAAVWMGYRDQRRSTSVASVIASRTDFWWDTRKPDEPVLFESTIRLGEDFYNEILAHRVPFDMHVLKALKRSPLGLDLYMFLTWKTFGLQKPLRLEWPGLYRQFGSDPAKAGNRLAVNSFRAACLRELKKIKVAWPGLQYEIPKGALVLFPTEPLIAPRNAPRG